MTPKKGNPKGNPFNPKFLSPYCGPFDLRRRRLDDRDPKIEKTAFTWQTYVFQYENRGNGRDPTRENEMTLKEKGKGCLIQAYSL